MRLLPCEVAFGIMLAILFVGVSVVSAEIHTEQYGGGYVQGWVYGCCTYDDQLIVIEWPEVTASDGVSTFRASASFNGGYDFYLPVGTYNLTAEAPGFKPQSMTIAVSDGASLNGVNFYLERSGLPIPEFPGETLAIIMTVTLAAALVAKRATKRKN